MRVPKKPRFAEGSTQRTDITNGGSVGPGDKVRFRYRSLKIVGHVRQVIPSGFIPFSGLVGRRYFSPSGRKHILTAERADYFRVIIERLNGTFVISPASDILERLDPPYRKMGFKAHLVSLAASAAEAKALLSDQEEDAQNSDAATRYGDEIAILEGVSAVLRERQQDYGPNPFNNETTAKAWQAILEAHFQQALPGPIPAHVVALMMGALKLTRAATPFGFRNDNYTDMVGYAMIAHRCDPRSRKQD